MRPNPLIPQTGTYALQTDLYELTMAAAYLEAGRAEEWVTFELFTRKLPPSRSFLLAAGLEQALHYIQGIRFLPEHLDYLRRLEVFQGVSQAFFEYLSQFRFRGDVYALPEGTVFFANEPILQVHAPVVEAQLLETFLINIVNFQTMVASKAARICQAARGKKVVDFGSRRAHSPQASLLAARAAFIGGCAGTSNVLAGFEMGIPLYGTMAHSFVQFFDSEKEAFEVFQRVFGKRTIALVDTYDTLTGVERALQLPDLQGIRLDSGDLAELALQSRRLLDQKGRRDVQIVASGNLDEEKILSFTLRDVPIDAYGVGTDLVVSVDAPTCDLVYKLVEVIRDNRVQPRIKASKGKATLPYRKQVFRCFNQEGFEGDLIGRWDEAPPPQRECRPLLQQYLKAGKLVQKLPDIFQIQEFARCQLESLPSRYRLLHTAEEYPVRYTRQLLETQKELEREFV